MSKRTYTLRLMGLAALVWLFGAILNFLIVGTSLRIWVYNGVVLVLSQLVVGLKLAPKMYKAYQEKQAESGVKS